MSVGLIPYWLVLIRNTDTDMYMYGGKARWKLRETATVYKPREASAETHPATT